MQIDVQSYFPMISHSASVASISSKSVGEPTTTAPTSTTTTKLSAVVAPTKANVVDGNKCASDTVVSITVSKSSTKAAAKNKNVNNFFSTTCILQYRRQKKNNVKCLENDCTGRPQWICDNKCTVAKKNANHFCLKKSENRNCFLKFHIALLPNGHYPNIENDRRACSVCRKRSFVSCDACKKRFCLNEKTQCFYRVSHDETNNKKIEKKSCNL